jgi:hypothetical protein
MVRSILFLVLEGGERNCEGSPIACHDYSIYLEASRWWRKGFGDSLIAVITQLVPRYGTHRHLLHLMSSHLSR